MTNLDLTPGQSLKNFRAKSLLNLQDVTAMLDAWSAQRTNGSLRIHMREAGRDGLARVIADMKAYLAANGLPDIDTAATGTRIRYSLDWYADGLQLGIEAFDDTARFLPDGTEAPPAVDPDDPRAVPEKPANDYELLHKSPARFVPVSEWAEANDVDLDDALEWAEDRLPGVTHDKRGPRISEIAYTPDAYIDAGGITYRFKYLGQLPEDLVKDYPELEGMVLDAMIAPNGKQFRLLTIHVPDGKQSAEAESRPITNDGKLRLLRAFCGTEGAKSAMASHYEEPFCQSARLEAAHHPVIHRPSKRERELLQDMTATGTASSRPVRPGEKSDEHPVELDISIQADGETGAIRIKGTYLPYDVTSEKRLLLSIFGWTPVRQEIFRTLDAAGLPDGNPRAPYPWNSRVLLIRQLESSLDPERAIAAMKDLPALVRDAVGLEPALITAPIADLAAPVRHALKTAGFETRKGKALAYARGGKVLKSPTRQA